MTFEEAFGYMLAHKKMRVCTWGLGRYVVSDESCRLVDEHDEPITFCFGTFPTGIFTAEWGFYSRKVISRDVYEYLKKISLNDEKDSRPYDFRVESYAGRIITYEKDHEVHQVYKNIPKEFCESGSGWQDSIYNIEEFCPEE